jgi:tRNA G10  N-methylase Trm11
VKKNIYFASFAAGTQIIVKDILESQVPDIKIYQLFDGAVLFETTKAYDKLKLYCFNNTFSVITFTENRNPNSMDSFIRKIINSGLEDEIISTNWGNCNTFRIIASLENQLVPIDSELKAKLEKLIASQSKLKINRSESDVEFWVLYRTEGFCYFMKRLSKHTAYDKILNRGELHPEIAFLMNWFAGTDKNDVLLDPFCGNGSIPLTRALHFPAKQIYAFDIDKAMINVVRRKIAEKKSLSDMSNMAVKQADIRDLDREIPDDSVDKIVTDPPWGLYKNITMGIEEFYRLAILKMNKVLKYNGTIVLLVSRQIDIEAVLKEFHDLRILQNFNVLVSGKKANLIKLKKLNE